MKITFDNNYESNILRRIIESYERSIEEAGKENSRDFAVVISDVKSQIDSHEIDQLFDYIGPLHCFHCKYTWTSVVGKTAISAPCPRCSEDVQIPETKFVKKVR